MRVRRGCQASQRKGLTTGEVWGTSGEVAGELPGKSGKLPGNLSIAVKFHSERTSGEVAGKLPGKFGKVPGKSGDFPEARGSLTPSQRLAKFVSKNRVFLNPWFGEPVVCTPDSRGFRNLRGFRDFRESSTQLLICSCLSCLCRFRRFGDFRRFRERRPAHKP